jgi:ferredoxin
MMGHGRRQINTALKYTATEEHEKGRRRTRNNRPQKNTEQHTLRRLHVPKLTVEGFGTFDVENGKRLVLAIEQDAHVDILHACGGNARCTTCRVEFIEGEPTRMTVAERQVLLAKGAVGVRLSCQMTCDRDMKVRAISRLAGSGRPDPGPEPAAQITPPVEWSEAHITDR